MSHNPNGFVTVIVLDDGETFSGLHNCSICIVPIDQFNKVIDEGGDARDFTPVVEVSLCNVSIPLDMQ